MGFFDAFQNAKAERDEIENRKYVNLVERKDSEERRKAAAAQEEQRRWEMTLSRGSDKELISVMQDKSFPMEKRQQAAQALKKRGYNING